MVPHQRLTMKLNNGPKENLLSVLRVGYAFRIFIAAATNETRLVELHSCIGWVHGQHIVKDHLHDGYVQRG